MAGTVAAFQEWWQRIFAPRADTPSGSAGVVTVAPGLSHLASMSTLARFPWIWVCVRARSGDLAGLPLVAIERTGTQETVLKQDPVLSLLRRPSPGCSGLRFRRQVYADWNLTGNSMQEHPASNILYRMHPQRAKEIVDSATGREIGWTYFDRQIPLEQVLHIADISWSDTLNMVLGETPIRAMLDDLNTVLSTKRLAANASKRGMPEMIMSPADPATNLTQKAVKGIEANYESFTRSGKGLFVVGAGMKVDLANLTPREIEYIEQRGLTRDMTLAVWEVPPARAGLASANYGTQKQQMRTYWEALIKGQAALFEDEWSLLSNDTTISIVHDTTNIEALQVNYTERQQRAIKWMVNFGMTAREAADFEGFIGAPVGNFTGVSTRPIASEPDEPQRHAPATVHETITEYLHGAAARYQDRILKSDGDVSALDARPKETMRLQIELERCGVPLALAVEVSDEVAQVTNDAVFMIARDAWERGVVRIGLENVDAFGPERATQIATDLQRDMKDHREVA